MLSDICHSNIFWDWDPKEREAKLNKRDPISLRGFCTEKGTINHTKRQPSECKRMFVNSPSDEQLTSKIGKTDAEDEAPTLWPPDMNS